jgi:soluble cytochrome b562
LKKKKKVDDIKKCAEYNIGFQKFLEQLENIKLNNEEEISE